MRASRVPETAVDPSTGRTPRTQLVESQSGERMWGRVADLLEQGADRDKLVMEIVRVTKDVGADVADDLRRRGPQMLREHRARHRAFKRRLRATHGPALDALYAVYVGMEEIGSDLQQIHRDRDDDLTDALLGLQARASLVLMEIHNALSNGFPHAAWARARSLHETAVIADVLSEHGREPGPIDLATRYLAHAVLDQASDLKLIGGSGGDVDPTFEASVQQTKQELLEQYGEPFARDYGWARPLFPELKPREPVRFARLEMLTGSQLNRLDYRLGGHHVHSSAWTLHLNRVQRGNAFLRLTGPMNRELSGPAVVAINAAIMTTRAVTFGVPEDMPDPRDLLAVAALEELAADAATLFDDGERLVDRREARLQRRAGPEIWREQRTQEAFGE